MAFSLESMAQSAKDRSDWIGERVRRLQDLGLEHPIPAGKGSSFCDEWLVECQCYAVMDMLEIYTPYRDTLHVWLSPREFNDKYNPRSDMQVSSGAPAFEDEYLFRVLRAEEDPSHGLVAKQPDIGNNSLCNTDIIEHVLHGSSGATSALISTAADLQRARSFRDFQGSSTSRIAAINIRAIEDRAFIYKIHNQSLNFLLELEKLDDGTFRMSVNKDAFAYTCRFKEVLLEGYVPSYAVRIVNDVPDVPSMLPTLPYSRSARVPACEVCSAPMVPRVNRSTRKDFLGCSMYFSTGCRYTRDLPPRGCFLPGTLLKTSLAEWKDVQYLEQGDTVLSVCGRAVHVVYKQVHEPMKRRIIDIRTREASLKVTEDHRMVVPGDGESEFGERNAGDVHPGDVVLCGMFGVPAVKVLDFFMGTSVVEIEFSPDLPVEAFVGPKWCILSKGSRGEVDTLSMPGTDDGF